MKHLFCGKNTGPVVVDIPDDLIAEGIICTDSSKVLRVQPGQGDVCHDANGKWIPVPGECACTSPKPRTREQWAALFAAN